VDDPCSAFSIWYMGGATGLIVFAFFDPLNGILYGNLTSGLIFGY